MKNASLPAALAMSILIFETDIVLAKNDQEKQKARQNFIDSLVKSLRVEEQNE